MSTRLLEMLDLDARRKAIEAITNAIDRSFIADDARQTQNEIRHRFNVCLGYVGTMRNDLGWSWQRIHDSLPNALRCKLEGIDWTPPKRGAWVSDPSTGLILPG
jgi:6-pyruvoyl-tetrahydropterin synthase